MVFFVLFERINLQRITVDNVDEKMNHTSVYTRSCIEITNENKNQMQVFGYHSTTNTWTDYPEKVMENSGSNH